MESQRIKDLQDYIHVLEGRLGMPLSDFSKKLQIRTNVAKVESMETGVVNTTGAWNSAISVHSITADFIIFDLTDKTTKKHSFIKKTPSDILALQDVLKKAPQFAMLKLLELSALTCEDSKNAITEYFSALMVVFLGNSDLGNFLTSNAYNPASKYEMSGHLMKKAVGLMKAGWKSRFYCLDTSRGVLLCGDSPSDLSDFLNLHNCYISTNNSLEIDNCFWIAYYKQINITSRIPLGVIELTSEGFPSPRYDTKHLLVAETQEARDDWVRCLAGIISLLRPTDQFNLTVLRNFEKLASKSLDVPESPISVVTTSKHFATVENASKFQIARTQSPEKEAPKAPEMSQSSIVNDENQRIQKQSEPAKLAILYPSTELKSPKKRVGNFKDWVKKKSGFDDNKIVYPVFGVTLQEAYTISNIRGAEIPTVLFRCIEYLEAKEAQEEEGLYRLSGSSSMIQNLRLRFDQEHDVDLIESDVYYDVHAVSGLLKLFFRELSEPMLTKELRDYFLNAINITERRDKIAEVKRLVLLLPRVNFETLKLLLGHLIRVVKNCSKNKMTVRNMSIVFSPTLGIPAGIFTLMMAEFPVIFYSNSLEPNPTHKVNEDLQEEKPAAIPQHGDFEKSGSSRYPSYGSSLRNKSSNSEHITLSAASENREEGHRLNSSRKRDTLFGDTDTAETNDLLNDLKTSFK